MYHVKTMNKISKIGLAELDDRFEISDTMEHEDAILVRSAKLHDYDFPAELAVHRPGRGRGEQHPPGPGRRGGHCGLQHPRRQRQRGEGG